MKYNLSVLERVLLLNVLPAEESFLTMKISKKLKEDLGFSEDEIKGNEIKITKEGQVTWKQGSPDKEIEIGEKALDIIVGTLKKLNETKKITESHIGLYERFVEKAA
jgi:hypothetical protein